MGPVQAKDVAPSSLSATLFSPLSWVNIITFLEGPSSSQGHQALKGMIKEEGGADHMPHGKSQEPGR